jgi:nicotinate-nucleotide adenylyltransferase
LEKFLIIPTGTPPHKADSDVPAEMRLEMCRLAAADSDGLLEVSDFETRRSGKSYSVITLNALHELYPDSDIYMIMGADMFITLETWYDFERLKTLATFCTMPRNGVSADELNEYCIHLSEVGCRGIVADVPKVDISSSEIRNMVEKSQSISGLVPPSVERYIHDNRLYL